MRDLEINGLTGEEETRRQYEYIEKARQYVAQKEKEAGRKLTCCVHTFGCQMNARDSEKLLGILTDIGYVETEDEHADFVIYNTCTVRENANNKIDRINKEIAKTREKITEYQNKLKGLEVQKTEAENLEIVQLVRAMRLTPQELNAMLSGGGIPGMTAAPAEENEQEENADEE